MIVLELPSIHLIHCSSTDTISLSLSLSLSREHGSLSAFTSQNLNADHDLSMTFEPEKNIWHSTEKCTGRGGPMETKMRLDREKEKGEKERCS